MSQSATMETTGHLILSGNDWTDLLMNEGKNENSRIVVWWNTTYIALLVWTAAPRTACELEQDQVCLIRGQQHYCFFILPIILQRNLRTLLGTSRKNPRCEGTFIPLIVCWYAWLIKETSWMSQSVGSLSNFSCKLTAPSKPSLWRRVLLQRHTRHDRTQEKLRGLKIILIRMCEKRTWS